MVRFVWTDSKEEVKHDDLVKWLKEQDVSLYKSLVYCDIDGLYVNDNGEIILCDECGNWEYVPDGVFAIAVNGVVINGKPKFKYKVGQILKNKYDSWRCKVVSVSQYFRKSVDAETSDKWVNQYLCECLDGGATVGAWFVINEDKIAEVFVAEGKIKQKSYNEY